MKQNKAIALISRIREKANRFIIKELEAQGIDGIVPSHGDILVHLFAGGKYTMKDLAEKIHRTKPTVTVLVDKLVDYGYVLKEKSLEDSRVTFIILTDKGLTLNPTFTKISAKLNDLVYSNLTDQEVEVFERALSKINDNFK